jgi:hypothetical protein
MGRFSKMIYPDSVSDETIDQRAIDEETYPTNDPRNALINSTLAKAANSFDPSGQTDKMLDAFRLSKADVDDARTAMRIDDPKDLANPDHPMNQMMMDMAMSSPAMGITKAQKVLGDVAGKLVNKQAAKIRPEGIEHLDNLQLIREFVKNPSEFVGTTGVPGSRKDVFGKGHYSDKIIKKMKPARDREVIYDMKGNPIRELTEEERNYKKYYDALQEQIMLNKIGPEEAVKTNTYLTGQNAYMVQPRVTPLSGYSREADDVAESIASRFPTDLQKPNSVTDMGYFNFGKDRTNGKIKLLDAGATNNITLTEQEFKALQDSLKKSPDINLSQPLSKYIDVNTFEKLLNEAKPNYVNDMLRLPDVKTNILNTFKSDSSKFDPMDLLKEAEFLKKKGK